MSKKFLVTIERKEIRAHTFEVYADNREEAEELAIEKSYEHDFRQNSVRHADEEVTLIQERG